MERNRHELASVSDRLRVQLLLRLGLSLAIVLMLTGVVLKFAKASFDAPSVRMQGIFGPGLDSGDRLMALGILALAFTPAFRVLTLVILWVHERDWRFVAVAITVLLVLALAIALGGA